MPRDKIEGKDVREEDIRPLRLWLVDGTFIDFKNRYYAHRDGYVLAPVIRYITASGGHVNIYEIIRKIITKVGAERFYYCMSLDIPEIQKHKMLDIGDIWTAHHFRSIKRSGWTPETPIDFYYKLSDKGRPSGCVDVTHENVREGNIHRRYSMPRMIYYSFNEVDMKKVHRAIVRKDTTAAYSLDNLKLGRNVNVDATMNRCKYGAMNTYDVTPKDYNEADYIQRV